MTLRRFVRVTIDNFRQLLQTISAPVTSLPMPPLVPPAPPDAEPPLSPHRRALTEVARGVVSDEAPAEAPADAPAESLGERPAAEGAEDRAAGSAPVRDRRGGDAPGGHTRSDDTQSDDTRSDDTRSDDTRSDDMLGGAQVGDEQLGGGRGDAPITDALGSEGADDTSPAHLVTPSPAHPLTLAGALESLLFVSDEAVDPLRLAQAIGLAPAEVEAALLALDAAYREERRGLRLQVRSGRYQLVTAPEAANLIETYLNLDAGARLSAPALETLAVVAYRQPVTRSQIEAVRGVDCSGVLRSLIGRGLLEEVGRLDAPGRPVLYGVTDLFMHHFGLTALHELPPLEDAEIAAIEGAGA